MVDGVEIGRGQGAVIVIYAPTQHFLSIFQNQPLMGRVVGKIVKFLRVCFQIKQQRRKRGEMDVFVALAAHHAERTFV